VRKLYLAFLIIFLIFNSLIVDAYSEENRPTIQAGRKHLSRDYPYKVYAYSYAVDGDCRYTDRIVEVFYDVLREFPKIIIRFVDEYPEYRKLVLLDFVNISKPDEATIRFKVVNFLEGNYIGFAKYFSDGASEILILCEAYNRGYHTIWNVIMHELLHALGLGHAEQETTTDGFPELMHRQASSVVKTYPSTLDLYALYMIHFTYYGDETSVTLPEEIEYKMVIPYSYEFQKLQTKYDILLNRLRNADLTIKSLQDQLKSTGKMLGDYISSYSLLLNENKALRNNLTRLYKACNQNISLLTLKLNQTYNEYANLTDRYNWLVETYNNLYQDFQTLGKEYDRLLQHLYLVAIIAYIGLSIILYVYLRLSRKYNRLVDEYNKLVEYLGADQCGGYDV